MNHLMFKRFTDINFLAEGKILNFLPLNELKVHLRYKIREAPIPGTIVVSFYLEQKIKSVCRRKWQVRRNLTCLLMKQFPERCYDKVVNGLMASSSVYIPRLSYRSCFLCRGSRLAGRISAKGANNIDVQRQFTTGPWWKKSYIRQCVDMNNSSHPCNGSLYWVSSMLLFFTFLSREEVKANRRLA